MARHGSGTPKPTMLPKDALPCVWMTAGLVAYKLCDRAYDCEQCPLDIALRGMPAPPLRGKQANHQPAWEFRPDRHYHAKHGWVLRLDDRRVRYGLDVFAARLLSYVSQVVLPAPKTRLCRDEAACWVKDAEELIPLAAPVSGVVDNVNHQIQTVPASISGSPYDDGWLLEILNDQDPDEDECLLTAESMRVQANRQLELLREQAGRHLGHDRTVGPTLHDGGEFVKDLWRVLGSQRYHDLVRPFIS